MAGLLEQYYGVEAEGIDYHIDLISGAYRMDNIHRARVGIKKIKAVHRLLGSSFPVKSDTKVLNNRYKSVFRPLGRYREINNTILLLRKFRGSGKLRKPYSEFQYAELLKLRSDIDSAIEAYNRKKDSITYEAVFSQLRISSFEEEIGIIKDFVSKETGKARCLLGSAKNPGELHAIRIALKNIKPFLRLLYPLKKTGFKSRHYRLLNRTESLLGKWHDRQILRESLELFIKEIDDTTTRLSCQRIISRIAMKEELKFPVILKRTNNCLQALEHLSTEG